MIFPHQQDSRKNDRAAFLKDTRDSLGEIYDSVCSAGPLTLRSLILENAVLIVVDMVNGFVKQGALASPNSLAINDEVARLAAKCCDAGIPVGCLCDTHSLSSPELSIYPEHCIEGTDEPELTTEIASACASYKLIRKNSTNALVEPEFMKWLDEINSDTFIICGVCTDICVQQLALSLKTWFNTNNKISRIIVPMNVVATYDLGAHDSRLTGIMALYNMSINGIELCSDIIYE